MIVVFGSINVDLLFAVERLPNPGETVLCPGFETAAGGKGLNQAVAASKAQAPGAPTVAMIGCLGEDGFADVALSALKTASVSTEHIVTRKEPTGCAAILVDANGENQITVASGANHSVRADQVPDSLLGTETLVLMQMEIPPAQNWSLMARIKRAGGRALLNFAPATDADISQLSNLDVLILNEIEAAMLAGQAGLATETPVNSGRALAGHFGIDCVISLGREGAAAFAGSGQAWRIGTLAIEPVDTVGAGDSFTGAFAVAIDQGKSLPDALHRASVGGALACLSRGAAPSMPTADAIERRLADLAPPVAF